MDLEKVLIRTKKDKIIVRELSLSVKKGEFLAILGPSGSGKTTLLDYLTGNFRSNLIYNGKRTLHGNASVKYVPQEDHLHGFYTVRQYFQHYITLNYGIAASNEDRDKIIKNISDVTGLSTLLDNRVGDVLLKGLSGGQKRRLSIALELISYPDILILDEPTTGLDSYSALKIVEVLKNLTQQGICVIATIHQPSSQIWEMLDRTLLLSAGRIIYEGLPDGAEDFFASFGKKLPDSYNPADFFMQNINADFDESIDIEKIANLWIKYNQSNGNLPAINNISNGQANQNDAQKQEHSPTNGTLNNSKEKKEIDPTVVKIETSPKNHINVDDDHLKMSGIDKEKLHLKYQDHVNEISGDKSLVKPEDERESFFDSATKQPAKQSAPEENVNSLQMKEVLNTQAQESAAETGRLLKTERKGTVNIQKEVDDFKQIFSNIKRRSNWCEKFLALSKRNFLNLMKNPGILGVRIFMYVMLCFMIGAMFFDLGNDFQEEDINSRANLLFYVNAFLVFMSIAALPFFMIERAIVQKEIINRLYGPFSYQVAAFLTNLPGVFLISILSTLFVVLMGSLNNFGEFLLVLFLSLVIAENIAICFSLLVPHYIIGMALVAGIYGMFMLCQGYMIVKSEIPDYLIWGYYIAFHTYSFEAFMYNEFKETGSFDSAQLPSGEAVLKLYEMEDVEVWKDAVILIGYALIIQVFIFIIMKVRFRRRHPKGSNAVAQAQ